MLLQHAINLTPLDNTVTPHIIHEVIQCVRVVVLLSEYQTMNNIQHVPLPHLIIRDDFYFLILFQLKVITNFN